MTVRGNAANSIFKKAIIRKIKKITVLQLKMCVNLCSLKVGSIEQIQKKCNSELIRCVCQAEKQLQLHDMSNSNTTNSLFKIADVRQI